MNRWKTLIRGVLRRCPNCGERHIFNGWWSLRERCPRCGLYFEREEGYWTGAIAINTVVTEFVFAVVLVATLIATWPDVPMVRLLIVAVALNILVPLIFYPISKTIWVAIDLILHPLEEKEQEEVERLQRQRDERGPTATG